MNFVMHTFVCSVIMFDVVLKKKFKDSACFLYMFLNIIMKMYNVCYISPYLTIITKTPTDDLSFKK